MLFHGVDYCSIRENSYSLLVWFKNYFRRFELIRMFEKPQQKWKVNGWRLLLILLTFAIGGSLTGLLGRKLIGFLNIENTVLFIVVYIIIITILWPLMVLVVSIFFGQYSFFTKYLSRMGQRLFKRKSKS